MKDALNRTILVGDKIGWVEYKETLATGVVVFENEHVLLVNTEGEFYRLFSVVSFSPIIVQKREESDAARHV